MKRALVLLAACAHPAPAPVPAPAPAPVAATLHGQVFDSCGPVDQPATTIIVTPADIACAPSGYGAFTRIEVWSTSRTGTVELTGAGGDGMRCPEGQDCENATAGTLDWGDATHPPHFTLTFADGTTLTGTLTLNECDFPQVCG